MQTPSHHEQWAELYRRLDGYEAYCPRNVKAMAMALTVLGYSARRAERELRSIYPGEPIPNFATIARWQRSRPANSLGFWGWMDIASQALGILERRFDEIERLPMHKAAKALCQIMELRVISGDGYRRSVLRYRP